MFCPGTAAILHTLLSELDMGLIQMVLYLRKGNPNGGTCFSELQDDIVL